MDTVLAESGRRATSIWEIISVLYATLSDAGRKPVFLFVADIHSLTTHPDPKELHGNVKNVLVDYLAAGIDPKNRSSTSKAMCRKLPSCIST